ncbi:hypothetical protein [Mycolicibacterium elephantis]|uniref:hypothetical protein n=1 Tax=Mycolicibacterium elephantis TaxID=81858 RepID=UPI000A798030|nr:hypothetical protein [Mycolicibacterium elephantis]
MVNLLSGAGIEGVLTDHLGPTLIVRGATVHEPGECAVPADGEIAIDAANVDYIQIF